MAIFPRNDIFFETLCISMHLMTICIYARCRASNSLGQAETSTRVYTAGLDKHTNLYLPSYLFCNGVDIICLTLQILSKVDVVQILSMLHYHPCFSVSGQHWLQYFPPQYRRCDHYLFCKTFLRANPPLKNLDGKDFPGYCKKSATFHYFYYELLIDLQTPN